MNKHALSSATHSTLEHAPGRLPVLCQYAFSLAGLLLLGGCNKGPAPAAPAAEPATTAQAAASGSRPGRGIRRRPCTRSGRAPARSSAAAAAVPAAPPPPPPPKEYTVPAGTPVVVTHRADDQCQEQQCGR